MAVAFDAAMTGGNDGGGTCQSGNGVVTISSTGITVGASATLLVMVIVFQGAGTTAPTSVTATWNAVSMAKQSNVTSTGTFDETAYIFTLVNPASGAKTLSCSWTNSEFCYMSAVSFTGTDTVTGVNASDNTTATNVTTITVPSDTSGATVATFVTDGGNATVNFTQIYVVSDLNPGGAATYELGGTSNAHTFTGAGGTAQALAGVHVIAPAAGGIIAGWRSPTAGPSWAI